VSARRRIARLPRSRGGDSLSEKWSVTEAEAWPEEELLVPATAIRGKPLRKRVASVQMSRWPPSMWIVSPVVKALSIT
jgi:hypothetical protein